MKMESLQSENNTMRDLDDSGCVQDVSATQGDTYKGQAAFLDLSDDVLLYVCSFLTPPDLKALGYTCPRLGALVCDRTLWTRVDARASLTGMQRLRWYLDNGLNSHTQELKISGYVDKDVKCLGIQDMTWCGSQEAQPIRASPPGVEVEHFLLRMWYPQLSRYSAIPRWPDKKEKAVRSYTSYRGRSQRALSPLSQLASDIVGDVASTARATKNASTNTEETSDDIIKDKRKPPIKCCGPQFSVNQNVLKDLTEKCCNITSLALEYCNLDYRNTNLRHFPPTLKKLSLQGSRFFNLPLNTSLLNKVQDLLPLLEYLNVSECDWFDPASLMPLSKVPNLRTLCMRECRRLNECVAYASLASRYGFQTLQVLDVRGSPLADSEVSAFGWMPKLEELYLSPPEDMDEDDNMHSHIWDDEFVPFVELEQWETETPDYLKPHAPAPELMDDEEGREDGEENLSDIMLGSFVSCERRIIVIHPNRQNEVIHRHYLDPLGRPPPRSNAPATLRDACVQTEPQTDQPGPSTTGTTSTGTSTYDNSSAGPSTSSAGPWSYLNNPSTSLTGPSSSGTTAAGQSTSSADPSTSVGTSTLSTDPSITGTTAAGPSSSSAGTSSSSTGRSTPPTGPSIWGTTSAGPSTSTTGASSLPTGQVIWCSTSAGTSTFPADPVSRSSLSRHARPTSIRGTDSTGSFTFTTGRSTSSTGPSNSGTTSIESSTTATNSAVPSNSSSGPTTLTGPSTSSPSRQPHTETSKRPHTEKALDLVKRAKINNDDDDKTKDGERNDDEKPPSTGKKDGDSESHDDDFNPGCHQVKKNLLANNSESTDDEQKDNKPRRRTFAIFDGVPMDLDSDDDDEEEEEDFYEIEDFDFKDDQSQGPLEQSRPLPRPGHRNGTGTPRSPSPVNERPEIQPDRAQLYYNRHQPDVRRYQPDGQLARPVPNVAVARLAHLIDNNRRSGSAFDGPRMHPLQLLRPEGHLMHIDIDMHPNFPLRQHAVHLSQGLVSDSSVLRFGRADNEIINYINIGPNLNERDNTGFRPERSNLRVLSITGYRNITDRSLEHLATAAPHLLCSTVGDGMRSTSIGFRATIGIVPEAAQPLWVHSFLCP